MDSNIEKYHEDYNFPSADKLYKLMKKEEVQQFKETKKTS